MSKPKTEIDWIVYRASQGPGPADIGPLPPPKISGGKLGLCVCVCVRVRLSACKLCETVSRKIQHVKGENRCRMAYLQSVTGKYFPTLRKIWCDHQRVFVRFVVLFLCVGIRIYIFLRVVQICSVFARVCGVSRYLDQPIMVPRSFLVLLEESSTFQNQRYWQISSSRKP